MKKFLEDFKSFAVKGNIVDLAVGVIIGGAFGKIVTSLVNDIITPLLSLLLCKINLATLGATLVENDANGKPVILAYGAFLQNVIDFLIIAMSIFIIIRVLSRIKRKEAIEDKEAEEKMSREEELLSEIRDLLKSKQ